MDARGSFITNWDRRQIRRFVNVESRPIARISNRIDKAGCLLSEKNHARRASLGRSPETKIASEEAAGSAVEWLKYILSL
jgi:hypothetical protein